MNGKGRPEKLTDELKREITTCQRRRKKKLKAPEIREYLRPVIENQIRKESGRSVPWPEKQIPAEVEYRLPGISAIQKYLKELTLQMDKSSPLDTPWHIGSMLDPRIDSRHNITPEAIDYIFKVKEWARWPDNVNRLGKVIPITIRQAYWIGLLYSSIPNIHKAQDKSIGKLWRWSRIYAHYELLCEVSKTDFDTILLDKSFLSSPKDEWPIIEVLENAIKSKNEPSIYLGWEEAQNTRYI